jgi:hypothetical protein
MASAGEVSFMVSQAQSQFCSRTASQPGNFINPSIHRIGLTLAVLLLFTPLSWANDKTASLSDLVARIKSIGIKGAGYPAAVAAQQELSSQGPEALLPLLDAMEGASPLAVNWLAGAFETIADRSLRAGAVSQESGTGIPAVAFEKVVLDRTRSATPRLLAFEWLVKVDPAAKDRLIPGMLDDPSADFRRLAVTRLIAAADASKDDAERLDLWKKGLSGATDEDQVKVLVDHLKEAGVTVDLARHFGYLLEWNLIGPFDNSGREGFAKTYPPEASRDLAVPLQGREGEVKWEPFTSTDTMGEVNLIPVFKNYRDSLAYAVTNYKAAKAGPAQIRLTTPNAWKVWVNGKLVFARDEYHRGSMFDQYVIPVTFQEGNNEILLKICQNEQTEDWAQKWLFKVRITDSSGKAILPAE